MPNYFTQHSNKMLNLIQQFFRSFWDFIIKSVGWLYVYLTPLHTNLITIYLLLACDLITGITKALKGKEYITASKLSLTVYKFIFYSLAMILAFQVDTVLFSATSLILTHLVGYYITLIEFKSNIENISKITNTELGAALKDKIAELLNTKFKKSDNENS